MDIDDWREKIDELDARLLELLNRRAGYALEIGRIKAANGQPIYLPEREAAVLERLRRLNPGPLSGEAVQRIFRQIIEESRGIEHGPEGTDQKPST